MTLERMTIVGRFLCGAAGVGKERMARVGPTH
jgi:hypothetical protein